MNYYERHIGDYLKDTAHLSLLEPGIYAPLLDIYSTREHAIPDAQVMRLVGARSDEERSAVRDVLNEFFTRDGEVWRHTRCDRELSKYAEKQRKASASANARWSKPQKDANAMRTHTERIPDAVPTQSEGNAPNHQTPVTSNQEDYGAKAPPSSARATVCKSLKAAGIADVNPSHPMLATLLDAGATEGEFIAAAGKAQGKANGFAYVLACVKGDRDRASLAAGQIHRGPLPNKQEALEARNRAIGEQWLKEMEARNAQ